MGKKKSEKKPSESNDVKKAKRVKRERKYDKEVEDTFPASDPITKY
ncbi:Uncharacterised protein [Legionella beliardensis]|uniref:Uncharacterized protein n=1 Tax=Legionella beliardensis TaxID=91822 RepID=A0A378I232_9GAMM|nr:hypothetical protein [Legionella beliardensis]STX29053.1 Uncharacterised protein [Legionella beliardensis]